MSTHLEQASLPVSSRTIEDIDKIIDILAKEQIDGVVTDATTALAGTELLRTIRRRQPQPALAVVLPFATERGDAIAVADVIEVAEVIDGPDATASLQSWVRESLFEDPSHTDSGAGGDCSDDTSVSDTLVDDIKRALVDTTEPTDIERAVCERLVDDGQFPFVWIGEYDRGERRVIPWATASVTGDWPTSRTFAVERTTTVKRALMSRNLVYVPDLESDDRMHPWRSAAIERNCQSMALVPLCAQEELVGLMGVYATEELNGTTLTALETIGTTTGDVLGRMLVRDRIEQQGRSLRQYERLVETVGDGMYTLDVDGHFMTVNDTLLSMTGYNREGILGEPWTLLVDQSDSVSIAETIERLRATEGSDTTTFETQVKRKDGSTFPGENRIALFQVDSSFGGTVGVLRDITERKRRERELERQNERVETFASIVSHDLRNPLGVAQGHLQREPCDREAIEESLAALDRMETIIDDVLALARHGEAATDSDIHELRAIATAAWNNVETRSARLVIDSSRSFVFDRSRVLRVFENCFRNAVEHGGQDCTVTVGCLSERDETTAETGFYIADDGAGLQPELRDSAFDAAITTSDSGHGLGLWIVNEVADAHDWTVRATESSSGGACFEFTGVSVVEHDSY
jgi:PAS domain S-box-containing protein